MAKTKYGIACYSAMFYLEEELEFLKKNPSYQLDTDDKIQILEIILALLNREISR
jgi:hypothetical protein